MRPKPTAVACLAIGVLAGSACTGVGPLDPTGAELGISVDHVVLEAIGAQMQLELELPDGVSLAGVEAVWRSSAPAIASVDGTGRVTALRHGQATIIAEAAGLTASTTVTVDADIVSTATVRSDAQDPAAANDAATVTITVQSD